jgi:hypothetical protein
VGPRLLLANADALFDGDKPRGKPFFQAFSSNVNVVAAWKVGGIALG